MKLPLKITLIVIVLTGAVILAGRSSWHVNRNEHNRLPTGRLKQFRDNIYVDEAGLKWELQPHIKNKFHQPDTIPQHVEKPYPLLDVAPGFDPENPNLKFLCETGTGGSYEAILQPDGTFLTGGKKQGTYNYGHPDGVMGSIKHFFMDVIPHFINSGYKTNMR